MGESSKKTCKGVIMKKLMLSLVLALVGLGLSSDVAARCHNGRCGVKTNSCESRCNPCEGKVTYSEEGKPCCIKRFACERQYPADVHIHKTYSCPTDCIQLNGDYKCQTELQEVPSTNGNY
jgi:hypothetical protein